MTYAELDAAVDRVARGAAGRGIERGDRVGIWAPNCAEWVLVQYATAKVGAILVNVNPAYRDARARLRAAPVGLPRAGRRAGVQDQRLRARWSRRCAATARRSSAWCSSTRPSWDELLAAGGRGRRRRAARARGDAVLRRPDQHPVHERHDGLPQGRDALATTTSSTTASSSASCAATPRPTASASRCRSTTASAWSWATSAATTHGACMVIPAPAFEPGATLRGGAGGALHLALRRADDVHRRARHARLRRRTTSTSLRTGIMAGSPCPVEVMRRVVDEMHMSEVTHLLRHDRDLAGLHADARRRPARAPRRRPSAASGPHVEVKVVDPDTGLVVPRGEPGELCTRGYSVMLGYWEDAGEDGRGDRRARAGCTPATWRRWTTRATATSSGASRTWSSAAARTSIPREVEEFLYAPSRRSRDVQVIGVPDERYGEELCAWVQLRDGRDARRRRRCASSAAGRIAHYKVPRYVHVRRRVPDDRHRQGAEVQDARGGVRRLGLETADAVKTA